MVNDRSWQRRTDEWVEQQHRSNKQKTRKRQEQNRDNRKAKAKS